MFFATDERSSGSAYLSDLNEELINAWIAVRDNDVALGEALTHYKSRDSKEILLFTTVAPATGFR